jgi:hypothetical protein
VIGCCENGDELSGYIICGGDFLTSYMQLVHFQDVFFKLCMCKGQIKVKVKVYTGREV